MQTNAQMKKRHFTFAILILLAFVLSACGAQRGTPTLEPISTSTPSAFAALATATAAPSRTPSPIPSLTPTPTQQPFYLTATVWSSDPIVPILAYHQFQEHGLSGSTHVRLDDFNSELQSLYQADYVMVPLSRWLNGDLRVPAGKRPIIFTMDDLFYRNQIRFNPDGTIDPTTGLGASYQFSQAHPDFGFNWALFSNLGDKPYIDANNPLIIANAVVWCIDHGALVYNHTYTHAVLTATSPDGIRWELAANDKDLNQLLNLAGRSDLVAKLGNIFSLPFGKWPRNPLGEGAILDYKNPSGVPLQAIMDVDFIYRPRFIFPPYSPQFNRWDIVRMVATVSAVDYFAQNAAKVPSAQNCKLGPLDQTQSGDANYLAKQIDQAIQRGTCSQGIYATDKFVFRAQGSPAELIYTVKNLP